MKTKAIARWTMALPLTAVSCGEGGTKEKGAARPVVNAIPTSQLLDVGAVVLEFNRALVAADPESLDRLCSEKLTYGHSNGSVQDKANFIDDLLHGPFDLHTVDSPEQTITLSGNTAVVRSLFRATATRDGEPVEIELGCLQIYERSPVGAWQLLARQAFKL